MRVEEHTAQISARTRREIELSFRDEQEGSVDVISGSTTFELGIDLGSVNAVFLANMPPQVANYRQRAGRAGRREGMLPVVVTYVRERPHDLYFWTDPDKFIAGPLKVPRFARPSHEVLCRHANAVFFSFLMTAYKKPSPLEGPPASEFVDFVLSASQKQAVIVQLCSNTSELTICLKYLLAANEELKELTPRLCFDKFIERIEHFRGNYLPLHAQEGSISVLSDYGILPSYNYPIYVDEMRLADCPSTEWPRSNLKLQRDRSIALTEFFPGKVILAGKVPIKSIGLWSGFQIRKFQYCKECSYVNMQPSVASCPNGCGGLITQDGIKPLGGFIGKSVPSLSRQDPDMFALKRGQYLFDPANNPPPKPTLYGHALRAARQTSFHIQQTGARMRTFSPRPDGQNELQLVRAKKRDVALPTRQLADCLVLPEEATGTKEKFYLMHEFTTDILRLQVVDNSTGSKLLGSPVFCKEYASSDVHERRRAMSILLTTIAQTLCSGGARLLDIDQNELAFTFRRTLDDAIFHTELIFFDTAPGGAGYCDQLYDSLPDWFSESERVLECVADCGDSCYSCLRSYENQVHHTHLNRVFLLEGLKEFNQLNWVASAGAGPT